MYTVKGCMKRKQIRVLLIISGATLLQVIPYLLAAVRWQPVWLFGGFLLNPIDGSSYLAKMQEGWAGGWHFTDLYSAQSTGGAYIFLFYLALGHFARLTHLSLLFVFHAARILAGITLLVSLSQFCDRIFEGDSRVANLAFILAAFGSGLGWAAALGWGGLTGDFWIAETYPFLSGYANPHFSLGLALVLWVIRIDLEPVSRGQIPVLACLGLLLSSIQPFGFLLAGFVLGVICMVRWLLERSFLPFNLVCYALVGGPYLIYQYWAIQADPILAGWNRQNLTPAPELGDFVISLSPAIFFAGMGIYWAWKQRKMGLWVLAVWLVGGILLVYLPFSLQRRMMTGLYIPVALLAVAGMLWLRPHRRRFGRWLVPAMLSFSMVTNLLVLAAGMAGALVLKEGIPNQDIFFSRAEVQALEWLKANTPENAVILAPPLVGLQIPAWAGRRVVYGHPFETPDALAVKTQVSGFFEGKLTQSEVDDLIQGKKVSYIFLDQNSNAGSQRLAEALGETVYDKDGWMVVKVER